MQLLGQSLKVSILSFFRSFPFANFGGDLVVADQTVSQEYMLATSNDQVVPKWLSIGMT